MFHTLRIVMAVVAAALVLPAGVALADPPGRAIRLAYTAGAVSFAPSGEDSWVEARINRPLWTGDRLWTAGGARAELQMGGATLRVAPETSVAILNFDDRLAQFELTQGAINVYVRALDRDDAIEIDTPNLALSIHRPGQYRIDVAPDATTVAVVSGEAEAFGTQAAYLINAGERRRFRGTDLADYRDEGRGGRDSFDGWVAERVSYESRSQSARYVAPELIGYADLDTYGSWRTVANHGTVWVPTRVAPDWAPYRYGHWAWIDPWGWTWVDDAPWGFAPFHYGRWAFVDDRYWAWVPGPRNVRPVYAPALVAFVGGDNFRLSVALGTTGAVAWFPLAPGEIYRPAYTASRDYFTRVNVNNTVVNVTSVTNVYNNPTQVTNVRYVNVNATNAVTAVPTQAFVQAQSVQRAAVRVDKRELEKAPVIIAAPVAPVRASVTAGPATNAKPADKVLERPVIAKLAPPAPPPSIERRAEALKQQPGKPLDRAELEKLAPPAASAKPNIKVVEPVTPKPVPSGAAGEKDTARASPPPAAKAPESRPQPAIGTTPAVPGDNRGPPAARDEGKRGPPVARGTDQREPPGARGGEQREPPMQRQASKAPEPSAPAAAAPKPETRVQAAPESAAKAGTPTIVQAPPLRPERANGRISPREATADRGATPPERRPAPASERSTMTQAPAAPAPTPPRSSAPKAAEPAAQSKANGSKAGPKERGEQARKDEKKGDRKEERG